MENKSQKIKFYVDAPYWFIRPNNTDWKYNFSLKDMASYAPLEAIYSTEHKLVFEENWAWLIGKIKQLFKIRTGSLPLSRELRPGVLVKSKPDIIYSHGKFPIAISNVPVVWFYGLVDPAMRIVAGETSEDIEAEYQLLKPYFDKATVIILPTRSMVKRHAEHFNEIKSKFTYAPFFLNYIRPISNEECVHKHLDDSMFKLLFVGREAKRKGLDILLEAITFLPQEIYSRLHIDVVTNDELIRTQFAELKIVHWHNELSKNDVQNLMKKAHVFVMPSRFESYGFVYIEAMAAGAVVIAPAWENQKEILDYGRSGKLIMPKVDEVIAAISSLADRETRIELATNALNRCRNEYVPAVVAKLHYEIFGAMAKQ